MKKLQKNNQKVKNCFQGDMKSWKMLKSWKKCGKVEKNANIFGKKQKRVEKKWKKPRKFEKFRKVEKSAIKSSKIWKNILDLSYLREEVIMRVSKIQCPHLLES